jgi:uncharacterized protein YjdB
MNNLVARSPWSSRLGSSTLVTAVLASVLTLPLLFGAGCGRDSLGRIQPDGIGKSDGSADGPSDRIPDGATDGTLDGTGVDVPPAMIQSISIDPSVATLVRGSSRTLVVTATYSDGTTRDVTAMATFNSSNLAFVTVNGATVTAVAVGTATIRANVGTLAATATITVSMATVTAIAVLPGTATSAAGTTVPFTADATLSDGTHQDVTSSAAWSTSAATVATVSNAGVASALTPGQATITATFMNVVGSARLTVTMGTLTALQVSPVDPTVGVMTTINFTATGIYSDGTRADLTGMVTWSTSAPAVVSISATGRALTRTRGTSTITAAFGGLTGTSTVTVTPAALVSIAVTPLTSTILVRGTAALRAVGTYSDGSTVDLTSSVVWSSAPATVASVSNAAGTAGTVTALAVGTATITATSGTIAGQAMVTVSPAQLVTILVSPNAASIPVGATVALMAQGFFNDGTSRDVTTQVAWSSALTAVATVSNAAGSNGVVTAVSVGPATITATLNNVVGTATVTVVAATLQSITVTPANAMTTVLLRSNYTATGMYSNGTTVNLTAQVTWATGNAAIAAISNTVGAEGQLLARANGMTTVSATLGTVTGTTNVTVIGRVAVSLSIAPILATTRVGTNIRFIATEIFSDGTQLNVSAQSAWTSSAPAVATINTTNNRGLATPVAVGVTTITATFMGFTATTTLTVTQPVITSITVTPIAPVVPIATVVQFTATAIFSDGTTQNVTGAATWTSSAPGVLAVTTVGGARGRGTGVSAGMATVTATFMGIAGSTTVIVTNAVLTQISVSPAGLTLAVGARRQFTAQAIFSDGTSRDVTAAATWTSDQPAVAGVSVVAATRGLVTAVGAGTANIQAAFGGLTGSVLLTVSPAMLVSIQVTPFNTTLPIGTAMPYQATGLLSDGTSTDLTALASWQSSDPTVAAVSNAAATRGLVTALAGGSVQISATSGGITGSTTLTVNTARVTTIQVTPFNPRLPIGFSQQLTATALLNDGTTRDITTVATWTSASPAMATVSGAPGSQGLVTAQAAGTATISAQFSGVTGSTTVTVSTASLTSMVIAPANPSAAAGATVAFTATGTFSDASTLDVTAFVTWTSSDTTVADVSNAAGSRGQATAFAAGATTIQAQRGTVVASTNLTVN